MEKTMVLWEKPWYYKQNYGSILRTMELRFTKKKKHCRLPKIKDFDLKSIKLWN